MTAEMALPIIPRTFEGILLCNPIWRIADVKLGARRMPNLLLALGGIASSVTAQLPNGCVGIP